MSVASVRILSMALGLISAGLWGWSAWTQFRAAPVTEAARVAVRRKAARINAAAALAMAATALLVVAVPH